MRSGFGHCRRDSDHAVMWEHRGVRERSGMSLDRSVLAFWWKGDTRDERCVGALTDIELSANIG
jgi:hypothetical protein